MEGNFEFSNLIKEVHRNFQGNLRITFLAITKLLFGRQNNVVPFKTSVLTPLAEI